MKSVLLATIIGLQTLWIGATVLQQERILDSGTVIHLECRPVDPRDLLRGDFVILSYDISTAEAAQFVPPLQPSETLPAGSTVWAELTPGDGFHRLVRVHRKAVDPEPGNILLKGHTRAVGRFVPETRVPTRIEYGLERYYVREGTGNPQGKLTADVAVSSSRQGTLKQVYVEGVPYADAMRSSKP
jgi:uncharacterized membrane-anchored protein